jgi:uncharacterized protein (DUF58 family)
MPRSLRATRAGWCFFAIVFGVGFAALNTGNNLLYLVLSLLLAFLVLSGLLSESSLRGIRVERRLPGEIFAKAPNRIALRVHNRLGRTPSFAILIEDRIAGPDGDQEAGRAFVLRVGPKSHIDRSYFFEPEARGELAFSCCRISTRFPFGLFVKSVDLELESTALVYPEIDPRFLPNENQPMRSEGPERRRAAAGGDSLGGLREYAAGDSVKRIEWRRSLRTRSLIVAQREGEANAQIEVLLQIHSSLNDFEIERRISRATSEIVRHLENRLQVGLRTDTHRFLPDSGLAHRTQLLSFLARVEPSSHDDLQSATGPDETPNQLAKEVAP